MSNVELKNQPGVTLEMLLKRRKQSLKQFAHDFGIQTYNGLLEMCDSFGVEPPSELLYNAELRVKKVTSQQDGIVVITGDDIIVNKLKKKKVSTEQPSKSLNLKETNDVERNSTKSTIKS